MTRPIAETKTCRKCGAQKPLTIANWHPHGGDRRLGQFKSQCRECVRAHQRSTSRDRNARGIGPRRKHKRNTHEEVRNYVPTRHCQECFGIGDRRPRVGKCACGEKFKPEPELRVEMFIYRDRRDERVCL